MNDLTTPPAVRALSLAASVAITALIISVHATDLAALGARDVVASGAPAIGNMHASDAQPAPRLALVALLRAKRPRSAAGQHACPGPDPEQPTP
jgi:hypothetical protein